MASKHSSTLLATSARKLRSTPGVLVTGRPAGTLEPRVTWSSGSRTAAVSRLMSVDRKEQLKLLDLSGKRFLLMYTRWRHFTKEMKHVHLSGLRKVTVSVWRGFLSSWSQLLITALRTTDTSTKPSPFWEEGDPLHQSPAKHATERMKNLRRHKLSPLGKRQKSERNQRVWSSSSWVILTGVEGRVSRPGGRLQERAAPPTFCTFLLTHGANSWWRSCDHLFFHLDTTIKELNEKTKTCGDDESSAFPPDLFIHLFCLFSFLWRKLGFFKVLFLCP